MNSEQSLPAVFLFRRVLAEFRAGNAERADVDRVYAMAVREYKDTIRKAQAELTELRALREHACSWDDDDRCAMCGADGCA
jgi:hypothetical protein